MFFKYYFFVSGEEVAVPAKKTKTFVSTSQISQTRQARVEKVFNILTNLHMKLTAKDHVNSVLCVLHREWRPPLSPQP